MAKSKSRGRWPIPSQIDLGSHLILVRIVGKKEMRDVTDHDDEQDLFLVADGAWDAEQDTIFIGKWLTKQKQRWTLLHELQHACLDYRDLYD